MCFVMNEYRVFRTIQQRDSHIIQRRKDGDTLQAIADEVGLTREAVRLIINRHNGPNASESKTTKQKKFRKRVEDSVVRAERPTANSIGKSLGISPAKVRMTLGRKKKELLTKDQPSIQRYSDEELLEILRVSASKVSGILSAKAYTKLGVGPTVAVYLARFGSWVEACRKAGVSSGSVPRTYKRRHSEEDMLDYVRSYLADPRTSGSADGYDEWQKKVDGAPSLALIRQRLGKWNEIKLKALRR